MSLKSRFLNIIFWSVVSAAFIGPGTITTAAKSGALFSFDLLWALLFSTLACLLLQEATARLTIASGKNLGQAIAHQFENSRSKWLVMLLILGAIVLGAAAYETGNILGAVAGFKLFGNSSPTLLIILFTFSAAIILSIPSLKIISTIMGFMVVIMGIGFFITALLIAPPFREILNGTFVPSIPKQPEAGLLVLGLVGTTIVPYNLFLGSGISSNKQSIKEMRLGLVVAILLGGIFSMSVLVVGTSVTNEFSFENLAIALEQKIGGTSQFLLGFGLFAAGFTSSVTAPLASSITLKSLFGNKNPEKWQLNSLNYRLGWIVVLIAGMGFALVNVKPIPAIIIAQALNGFLLPFVAIFLYIAINNPIVMGHKTNPNWLNAPMLFVLLITLFLGLNNAGKALLPLINKQFTPDNIFQITILFIATTITFIVARTGRKKNKATKNMI